LRHKAPKNKSSFLLTDGALAEWGASEQVDVEPAKYFVRVIKREKARPQNLRRTGSSVCGLASQDHR